VRSSTTRALRCFATCMQWGGRAISVHSGEGRVGVRHLLGSVIGGAISMQLGEGRVGVRHLLGQVIGGAISMQSACRPRGRWSVTCSAK